MSHLIILYWLHKAKREVLQAKLPSNNEVNPIAFSIAEIISLEGNRIKVKGVEAFDGSPLLDIKAYISDIDCVKESRVGWINKENQPRH